MRANTDGKNLKLEEDQPTVVVRMLSRPILNEWINRRHKNISCTKQNLKTKTKT